MNYELEKKYHISFCGSYCHLCDWHTGKIRQAYQAALDMFEEYGLSKQIKDKIDVGSFKSALNTLAHSSICPGCKAEVTTKKADDDRCTIRQCCYSKGYSLCNECNEFPCETLKSNPGVLKFGCIENLEDIKSKGLEQWIESQWKKHIS